MPSLEWVDDLDADSVCAVVVARHATLLETEAEQFYLAAHWADLHSGEALEEERLRRGRRALPGQERARRIGAEGTPTVAEFAPAELGALQGLGHVAASHLVRDALNVRHRHPLLWAAIGQGTVRVWQARKTAQLCADAGLDSAQARRVDEATTPYLSLLPWGRFLTLLEAKVIETDPDAAEERRRAAALARFVRTGQSTEHGLKTLVARANAGDVIFFVAMVDRIAQILCRDGDTDPADVLRSKAIGILATPARALAMLQAASASFPGGSAAPDGSGDPDSSGDPDDGHPLSPAHPGVEDPEVVGESDVHPSQNDADDPTGDEQHTPTPQPCPGCAGTGRSLGPVAGLVGGGPTGDAAAFTRTGPMHPKTLLPNATLYIHITADMLDRDTRGVARFEGVGPITRQQAVDFLGHTNVRVVPVIDLAHQAPVDGYEVPARIREALHLRNPACVFPWSPNLSRRKDHDHVQPYLPPERGGPPGQTSMGNLAGLTRFAHRLKTHGRWRLRQTAPGSYEWTSPRGYLFHVDHTGTRPLGKPQQSESVTKRLGDPYVQALGDPRCDTSQELRRLTRCAVGHSTSSPRGSSSPRSPSSPRGPRRSVLERRWFPVELYLPDAEVRLEVGLDGRVSS